MFEFGILPAASAFQHRAEFLRCLNDLDLVAARRLWAVHYPNDDAIRTDFEAAAVLHCARTLNSRVPERKRLYSHNWLLDHGLPSGLPEALKPRAERAEAQYIDSVIIGRVDDPDSFLAPIWRVVQARMERRCAELQADGLMKDPAKLRALLLEARDDEIKRLVARAIA